ncbi:MAG TPA: RHS repeat-associated core domain-containing protein, partial [Chryseosolibacter sp.]
MAGNQGDTRPSAYLNYILYDKDYKLLDMGWTAVPASANFAQQQMTIPTVTVKEPGYIFVYLSYEGQSNQWVNFDDFKVTHTKTNVIQSNDYYPFGLSASTSWTREGSKNDFLYNAGSEINVTTGWYDLPFRNYDPALGRFMQVDPMSVSEMATYQYGGNNPVMMNDPMGLSKNSDAAAAAQASIRKHLAEGNEYSLWNGDGGALGGAVGGGSGRSGGGGGTGGGVYRDGNGDLIIDFDQIGEHGGTYNPATGYRDFESDQEALEAGVDYLAGHNGFVTLTVMHEGKNYGVQLQFDEGGKIQNILAEAVSGSAETGFVGLGAVMFTRKDGGWSFGGNNLRSWGSSYGTF